jgi:cephalosporin hydroxylase
VIQTLKNEANALRYLFRNKLYVSSKDEKVIVEQFHKLYYNSKEYGRSISNTYWRGIKTLKCPLDLWVYQEILHELKPDLVIETGTAEGGSAFFLASMMDLAGRGQVLTIDIQHREGRPQHPRISYLLGSSTDESTMAEVRKTVEGKETVLVILDSDHRKPHVDKELRLYHPFVTKGSYLIVEDTNVNGHPVDIDHGPGPMEALEEFLKACRDFTVDEKREKFYLTFNPRGYLKKIR